MQGPMTVTGGWDCVSSRARRRPNDIILHINLMDPSNVQQQEAVGILGVNLIYAAYYALASAGQFLASIFEDLGLQRVEIDCLECTDRPSLIGTAMKFTPCSLPAGTPRRWPFRPTTNWRPRMNCSTSGLWCWRRGGSTA